MVDVVFCSLTSQSLLKTNGFKGVGRQQPHRGLFPGETSKWQLKIVGQRTNGWWADGLSDWQTEARNCQKWSINCICQLKNKSVCQSTIGSLADGIAKCISTKTMIFKHRVMFAVSLLNRFLKPMVLRPSVASSGVSQLVFVQSHKFRLQKNQWSRLVRLKKLTSTIGSFADGMRETRQDALKPLVFGRSPVVRLDKMP